jgi:hypothetical protein
MRSLHFAIAMVALALAALPGARGAVLLVKEANFKMDLPDGWEVLRKELAKDGKTWVLQIASKDKQVRMRVRAMPIAGAVDLKNALKIWEEKVLNLATVQHKQTFVSPEQVAAGRKSIIAFYEADMVRKTTVQKYNVMTSLVHDPKGMIYILAAFVQSDRYAAREPEMTKALSSFDVLGAAREIEDSGHKAAPPGFGGRPTKQVQDPSAGWELTIPADYVVQQFGGSAKEKHYFGRLHSPKKNVRVFVDAQEVKPGRYDFAQHWKQFGKVLLNYLETIEELKGAAGDGAEKDVVASFRSYSGYAHRHSQVHPYRVMAFAGHYTKLGRVYSVTIAIHRDEFIKNEGIAQAIVDSFKPITPKAPAVAAPAPAAAPKKR